MGVKNRAGFGAQPSAAASIFAPAGVTAWMSRLHVRLMVLVLVALLPLFAVVAIAAWQWRERAVADAQDHAAHSVRLAATIHQRNLQGARNILTALTPLIGHLTEDHVEPIGAFLRAELRHHPHFDDLGVADSGGRILASARMTRPAALVEPQVTVAEAIRIRRFAVSDYVVDPVSQRATATLVDPVVDKNGDVRQLLYLVVNLEWLREFADEAQLPPGTATMVFASDGRVIARLPDSPAADIVRVDDVLGLGSTPGGIGTVRRATPEGIARLVAFGPLIGDVPGRPVYLAIGVPAEVATAGPDRILRRDLAAFAFAFLFAAGLGLAGSDMLIVRPVTRLIGVAARLMGGDLSARAGPLRGAPELKRLGDAFDAMAATLERRDQELQRQHNELLVQERRYRALIENSADGVVLLDEAGTVQYTSPSNQRITGYPATDVVGTIAFDYVHDDDRARLKELLAGLLQQPGASVTQTFRLRAKDGAWLWIEADHHNLLHDPAVRAIVANFRDVTATREAEESLRRVHEELEHRVIQRTAELLSANDSLKAAIADHQRAEDALQKLSRAIEQTADSVFVTNRDGIIEYANPAFELLTGFSRSEAVGSTPNLFSSGLHDKAFYDTLWRRILAGEVFRAVVTNRHKDGHLYDEDQTITPLRDGSGHITHFVATGRDITQRKRTEEALRRLNAQLELEATRIAGILHDEAGQFLMSSHITLAELARDADAPLRDRLRDVRRNLEQVEEQLRRVSREIHPRILDDMGLADAIRFIADAFSRRTGIRVSVDARADACDDLPVVAVLYRLIQEGLTNVSRHARATEVAVELRREGRGVTCVVRDNGTGFNVEEILGSRERGLGLRLIGDRLAAVGGTLQIHSDSSGTELRATIPQET